MFFILVQLFNYCKEYLKTPHSLKKKAILNNWDKIIYNKWRAANKNQNMISRCQFTNVDKLRNMTALFEYEKQKLMAKRLLIINLLKKIFLFFFRYLYVKYQVPICCCETIFLWSYLKISHFLTQYFSRESLFEQTLICTTCAFKRVFWLIGFPGNEF